jgi:tRNA pseudouridine55 synthase
VTVERAPRAVTIHSLRLEEIEPQDGSRCVRMSVACSKGTYIRTLAQDIGEALGCGAHLSALRRVQTGDLGISSCVQLQALEAMDMAQRLACLQSVDSLLAGHAPITLDADNAGRFLSGLRRRGTWDDAGQVAVYAEDPPALLGIGHVKAGELIPTRLLSPLDIAQMREQAAWPT